MKIYIANNKNESFEDCKARIEAAKKQADQKKAKEAKSTYKAPAYNPFNDLN